MELRTWQSECINQAMMQYRNGQSHFLCLATPGAGKTIMASMLAKRLIDGKLIDLVICISPAIIVADDFRHELEVQLGKKLDGKLGSIGKCLTYHSMLLENDLWALFKEHRVFVIFDEIHHCSGNDLSNTNAWGQKIISEIQGKATCTLALTGTPWRSDSLPITLSRYTDNGTVHCDYRYGLAQAISDNVCRTPNITLIDNDKITLTKSSSTSKYKSLNALFTESDCSYQSLIESESLIEYMLIQADKRLNLVRYQDPKAGGLIVASSVSHAKTIHNILRRLLNENAIVVTYLEPNAVSLIKKFKLSNTKWIISVGMISEGTNIPRLKVCCYLTRVKTELYFRQVLGRILRANGQEGDKGYLYMPSEPTLTEYAHRVDMDIPDKNIIHKEIITDRDNRIKDIYAQNRVGKSKDSPEVIFLEEQASSIKIESESSILSSGYERSLKLPGKFKLKSFSLSGSTS